MDEDQVEKEFEMIEARIDGQIESPFISARFGDNWKDHVKAHPELYSPEDILDLALRNGRRIVCYENIVRELLRELRGKSDAKGSQNIS